ncbi:hypothetical protein [Salipiger mangrovisoli]|uniref:hypothetical protein n=1 Tax=Salipiger mangrovisoli TaxID=2865933 RepID=UPI003B8340C7
MTKAAALMTGSAIYPPVEATAPTAATKGRGNPSETQEMVFDIHDRAVAVFVDACPRGLCDSVQGPHRCEEFPVKRPWSEPSATDAKTAVETIFLCRERA